MLDLSYETYLRNYIIRGCVPSMIFIPWCKFLIKFSSFVSKEAQRDPRSSALTVSSGLIGVKTIAADSRCFMKSLSRAVF